MLDYALKVEIMLYMLLRPLFMAANNRSDGTQICAKSEGLRSVNHRSVGTLYGLLLHRFVEVVLYTHGHFLGVRCNSQ